MAKSFWIVLAMGLSLCASANAGAKETASPMSGAAFEAYVTGQVVTYAHDGRVYGMEQYLGGRRVVWRHLGGDCLEGAWFEQGDQICFQYEGDVPTQCWQFFENGTGLGARADGDPDGMWLYEVRRASEDLMCPAPYLGT